MEEGIYEPLGQHSLVALARIRSNGKHLLGLINTVLDIAKIESGQFILNMAEYSMAGVVETVRTATESLAQSKKLAGSPPCRRADRSRRCGTACRPAAGARSRRIPTGWPERPTARHCLRSRT